MRESDAPGRIPDDEARGLWQRAIELQMAAERQGESPKLSGGPTVGFSLEGIVRAAEGAGIDPDHVLVALAERRLPDALEASALIAAPPARAMEVSNDVVARSAFSLTLEDRVGPDPPQDGVFVYRIDRPSPAASSFHDSNLVTVC